MAQAKASAGAKKEVTELLRAIRANGYKTVPSGGGHKKVVDRHGKAVVDSNGPLLISSSPSDHRWRDMHVKRLMKAGVLKEDPWNPEEKTRDRNQNGGDPQHGARVAAMYRKQIARDERTRQIRMRLEPMVARLGGWDKQGFTSQIGRVMFSYARSRGRVEAPVTEAAAVQNARNLKGGATLSDKAAVCWELLLTDLEQAFDESQEDGLRGRYFELVREAQGLGTPRLVPDEPEAPAALELVTEQHRRHPVEVSIPSLALEVAIRMGMGAASEPDMDQILVLAERIARMEMEAS